MRRVLILAFENTVASTFTGPLDVFHQAGSLFNRLLGNKESPCFDVKLVTLDGKPFTTRTGLRVIPHMSIEEARQGDLVVISSLASLNPQRYPGAVDWLREHADRGANIASICTGAFLLAATGLLDGKIATTHWAFADSFRKRFPSVDLRPERIITDEGRLFCSAGFTAGMDLSLYLVEKFCGSGVALESAKIMVHDFNRASQLPYSVFRLLKDHKDNAILKVQNWIENHYSEKFDYQKLAKNFGFTKRTLERRFQAASGVTPLIYIQKIRVEVAKRLLEESKKNFEEITWEVGYGDGGFFRKLFEKETGLHPADYRKLFRRAT